MVLPLKKITMAAILIPLIMVRRYQHVWYGYFNDFPLVKLIGHDIIYFIFTMSQIIINNIFTVIYVCNYAEYESCFSSLFSNVF